MRSFWKVRHLDKSHNVLWEDFGPNVFHDGGEEWLCKVAFSEQMSVPSAFYIGLDNRTEPSEEDTLASLSGEPTGNGYARQAVNSDDTDWTVSQDSGSGDWQALSKTVTFTANGGSIGPVTQMFLATSANNSGVLICTRPLSQERTLADGESLECSLYIRIGE
jgi:hypothetical protein